MAIAPSSRTSLRDLALLFLKLGTIAFGRDPYSPRRRSSGMSWRELASLALMAVVTWHLGRAALVDWVSVVLALVSALLLLRYPVNSAWVVLGGGLVGVVLRA